MVLLRISTFSKEIWQDSCSQFNQTFALWLQIGAMVEKTIFWSTVLMKSSPKEEKVSDLEEQTDGKISSSGSIKIWTRVKSTTAMTRPTDMVHWQDREHQLYRLKECRFGDSEQNKIFTTNRFTCRKERSKLWKDVKSTRLNSSTNPQACSSVHFHFIHRKNTRS